MRISGYTNTKSYVLLSIEIVRQVVKVKSRIWVFDVID